MEQREPLDHQVPLVLLVLQVLLDLQAQRELQVQLDQLDLKVEAQHLPLKVIY
jgi:hypothetical protein